MRSTRFTVPTADELAALARIRQSDVVSLLLPPLPAAEAHLTLRNLVKRAGKLLRRSMRAADAQEFLHPVHELLDDHAIWASPIVSLAMYVGESELHVAAGPERGEPLAVVGPRWHVAHLLTGSPAQRYAVLVLTRGTSHLYRGRAGTITETRTAGLPAEMAEVLRYDDREPQLQSHGSARRGGGTVVAAFHGQGGRGDQPEDVARYLRFVAAEVEEVLGGEPLVLAATNELAAAFRKIAAYAVIEPTVVPGNAEHTSLPALATQAEAILAGSAADLQRASVEQFASAAATGSALSDLGEILTAAHDGRIEQLAVIGGNQVWGRYDSARRRVSEVSVPHDGVDLVNEAAAETWLHGGEVLDAVDAPVPAPWQMAATVRF